MPRRGHITHREVLPDPIYGSKVVTKLVNNIMLDGKKGTAQKIVYGAFDRIAEKTGKDALEVFEAAMNNIMPVLEVKARRVGGSTHQVPIEIGSTQGKALAIRWLLAASRKRPGRNMAFKLSSELVDAAKGSGDAIRKKEETHRMAEANRAFAHFR